MNDIAIRLHHTGPAANLTVETLAPQPPAPGQVRIRHTAIGVNYVDIYHRTGIYPMPLPGIPGVEAAGIVEETGAGVSTLVVGQRVVYAMPTPGSYASTRNVPAERVLPIPAGVPDAVAAGSLLRGVFCYMLMNELLRARPGDTLLVHAAAGGLGLALSQWARDAGLRVLGTVGSQAKADLARAHGLDEAILYRETDFVAAVLALTDGRGVDFAVDGVGGETLLRTVDALRPCGLLASVGMAGGPVDEQLVPRAAARNLAVARPSVTRFMADVAAYRAAAQATLGKLGAGHRVHIGAELPLRDAARAHQLMESSATEGVLVLVPD